MKTETILEVQNYFKEKLVKGEFDIKKVDEYTVDVLVDKDYKFNIWTSNGDFAIGIDKTSGGSFMNFEFNEEERKSIYNHLKPNIEKFKKEELLASKKAEYENLLKEINNIQNETN